MAIVNCRLWFGCSERSYSHRLTTGLLSIGSLLNWYVASLVGIGCILGTVLTHARVIAQGMAV